MEAEVRSEGIDEGGHDASSSRKHEANRRNAKHSTGPRTASGRAKSSLNALKHGLLARVLVAGDEDPDEFGRFASAMRKALQPKGGLEETIAQRVLVCAWRLRRFERMEALMLDAGRKNWTGVETGVSSGFVGSCVNGDIYTKLGRYEAGVERAFFRSLHELQRLQAARCGHAVPAPLVVDVQVSAQAD